MTAHSRDYLLTHPLSICRHDPDGEPRPDSICQECGELLQQYGDGYGHLRGWCREDV